MKVVCIVPKVLSIYKLGRSDKLARKKYIGRNSIGDCEQKGKNRMEWNEQYKKELEIIKLKRDELKKQNINELKATGYEMGMKIQLENGNESPFKNWKKKFI